MDAIKCSACNSNQTSCRPHPLLSVPLCNNCLTTYHSSTFTLSSIDNHEVYCRWCGNGGALILCEECPKGFCCRCIKNNFGSVELKHIQQSSHWSCFVCNPNPMIVLRNERGWNNSFPKLEPQPMSSSSLDIVVSPTVQVAPTSVIVSDHSTKNSSVVKRRRKSTSNILKCTACKWNRDAEYLHPILNVPICGACRKTGQGAFSFSATGQEERCLWCGDPDGSFLFMCDSCPYSICVDCVTRNFSAKEAKHVHRLATWSCYVCAPTPAFVAKQLKSTDINSHNTNLMNIEMAYNSIRPPSADLSSIPTAILNTLTPSEGKFLRLFTDQVVTESSFGWCQVDIFSYLHACDLMTLRLLSKNLRRAFQHIILCPGLFQTPYGEEHNVRLFDHQVASLSFMCALENKSDEFGSLRGGILADAPGLGKTVTVLALVSSTCGLLPRRPVIDFDPEEIRIAWEERRVNQSPLLLPFVNWMIRSLEYNGSKRTAHPLLNIVLAKVQSDATSNYASIDEFKVDIYKCVNELAYDTMQREVVKDRLRHLLQETRETLGKKKRARNSSADGQRASQERSLRPSGATLIIVPLVLLEHWFEQISRHLGLQYLVSDNQNFNRSGSATTSSTSSNGMSSGSSGTISRGSMNPDLRESLRGIVYLDGLGDIVDVQAPLEKLYIPDRVALRSEQLAQYFIVVTTIERCGREWRLAEAQGDLTCCPFLTIRWLRLIVDEGHDIGHTEVHSKGKGSSSSAFDDTRTASSALKKSKKRVSTSNSFHTGLGATVLSNDSNQMLIDSAPSTAFISFIAAERRWVMSGTPTTGSQTKLALHQLHKLLCFLRHPSYGVGEWGMKRWRSEIADPFMAKDEGSFERLCDLLKGVIVRHNKEDLKLFEPIMTRMDVDALYLRIEDTPESFANFRRGASRFYEESTSDASVPRHTSNASSSNDVSHSRTQAESHHKILNMRPPLLTLETKVEAECRAKAAFIAHTVLEARKHWLDAQRHQSRLSLSHSSSVSGENTVGIPALLRRPKAIVFSQTEELHGVAHYLYLMLGDSHVCEHMKTFRSAELSRFRNSKRKYRICPLCGTSCTVTDIVCPCVLLLVEYLDLPSNVDLPEDETEDDAVTRGQLYGEGGYVNGTASRGHFVGACLCSPMGCLSSNMAYPRISGPLDPFFHPRLPCGGWPNPLYKEMGQNRALVADRDVAGATVGTEWRVGQNVYVNPAPPVSNLDNILREEQEIRMTGHSISESVSAKLNSEYGNLKQNNPAVLWRHGRMGGRARILQWARCGGRGATMSWCGDKLVVHIYCIVLVFHLFIVKFTLYILKSAFM